MSVEAALSLWAAWTARSPALAAFGGDSAVELMSAAIVLWRFRKFASEHAEQRAARIAGGLLFALTFYVILASTMSLLGYIKPRPSYLGTAVLVGAALIMPALAKEKRRLSVVTGSAALRADGAESALCAYLSIIALIGLAVHGIWHIAWARPGCSIGNHSADRRRGSEGYARQGLCLLLATNPHTPPTLMDGAPLKSAPTSRLAVADNSDKNLRGERKYVSGEGSCHPERNADHTSSVQA